MPGAVVEVRGGPKDASPGEADGVGRGSDMVVDDMLLNELFDKYYFLLFFFDTSHTKRYVG